MKFTGVMPALVTPLNPDENLNTTVLEKLLAYLLEQGADGFYIGGATGEGIALRREVREALAEEAIRIIDHRKPCIIHVASTVFSETIALARQAERCGAEAVSAIPPLFYPYDENDVYAYYKAIADAVHIPVMVYYNPAAGFRLHADFAARLFTIDNVTAIKWTSSDYFGMSRVKDLTHGEMNVINGPDEMLLMGLSAGADGGIGTTYNFMLPTIKAIYENFQKGDIAAAGRCQTEANRLISLLMKKYTTIPATKFLLEALGFAVGEAAFPQKRYTPEEKQTLITDFRLAGNIF